MACIAAKPIVDRIEREHQGKLAVIRINVQEPGAAPLLEQHKFQFTPTFILFDATGKEIWRSVGSIDPTRLRQLLTQLS